MVLGVPIFKYIRVVLSHLEVIYIGENTVISLKCHFITHTSKCMMCIPFIEQQHVKFAKKKKKKKKKCKANSVF